MDIAYRDKKVVGVSLLRFRATSLRHQSLEPSETVCYKCSSTRVEGYCGLNQQIVKEVVDVGTFLFQLFRGVFEKCRLLIDNQIECL